MEDRAADDDGVKILVFSSETISDPGIDYAGSAHMQYSPSALVIPVPCSSGVKPGWVLHALERGFDGVFIAADGSDCAYLPDCTARTGELVSRAQALLAEHDREPKRLRMAAICSVCADAFVKQMNEFEKELRALREGEGGDGANG